MTGEEQHRFTILLEDIQSKVTAIGEGQSALVERLDRMESRFDTRFETLETRLDAMEARFEARFDVMETRFGVMETRFVEVDARLIRIERHVVPNGGARKSESDLQRRLRPLVTRVFSHHLSSNRRVMARPEAGEIGRDLHRALIRRKQMEDQRDATLGDLRRLRHPEEVLHARRDPRGFRRLVVDFHAPAACEGDSRRGQAIDSRARGA